MMWAFTHVCCRRVTPYLWSNQDSKRDVVNPDESTAKSSSTAFSGRLLSTIMARRIGVTDASSR
jgi:hypothetical protein